MALNILTEAKKIDPANERIYFNLALLYAELNKNKEAEQCFSKAIELKSPNPKVYYNYGILLQQTGDNKKAESILQKGLAIDPLNESINYALALLYINTNRKSQAILPAPILKKNNPDNPDYQQLFALLAL